MGQEAQKRIRLTAVSCLLLTCGGASAQCEIQKLIAPDATTIDQLGALVAVDGAVAIVGTALDPNRVYVFAQLAGSWNLIQTLRPAAPTVSGFGGPVDLSGDAALVGSFDGAFVFRRQGPVWVEEAQLTNPEGAERFGLPVAVSGDVALVGFPLWIFRFDGTQWVPEDKLERPDPQPETPDMFGSRVALGADVAVVAAPFRDLVTTQEGAAYVFRRNGTQWNFEQKLVASNPIKFESFGWSLAIDGDVLVVGAWPTLGCFIPENTECQPGWAYVFRYDGATWVEEQKLLPSDGEPNDRFGDAVGVSGDTVVVGAPEHPAIMSGSPGAAYVYHWDGAMWVERAKLTPSDAAQFDEFGGAVGVSGETAIIGAIRADGAAPDSGAAYAFAVAGDCNTNGQVDACEALADPTLDVNGNQIIDSCEGIPAISHWGIATLTLLILSVGSIVITRRRREQNLA